MGSKNSYRCETVGSNNGLFSRNQLLGNSEIQQWELLEPIAAQQWDLQSHLSKNDQRLLLEDSAAQQRFGLTLVWA
jgi:uncharacterized membrane-anchored protein YhcB (DUF1043 family)